jgi:hypothetical protein
MELDQFSDLRLVLDDQHLPHARSQKAFEAGAVPLRRHDGIMRAAILDPERLKSRFDEGIGRER